jgi:DNA-binding FrmR family transcriptional regulator
MYPAGVCSTAPIREHETKEARVPGYTDHKDQVAKRLRRIEGQVRGLQQMIEADRYCIDVLTQVAAVTKALQAVAIELMGDHLGTCVSDAVAAGGPEAEDKITEAVDAIARLVRS